MTDAPTPADYLERARTADANSTNRRLLVAASFSAAALSRAVLVGGAAVDVHTNAYSPTNIDLVGEYQPGHEDRLAALGFRKDGRYWVIDVAGEEVGIEVPGYALSDLAAEAPTILDLEPGSLAVIDVTDLMMDRLLQATGGEPVTYQEAVRLAVAAYAKIDWNALEERAAAATNDGTFAGPELPPALTMIRREAIRRLRDASR